MTEEKSWDIAAEIKYGEGKHTEFKQAWTQTALKDIAAFINTDGGVIYIGINDTGEILGIAGTKLDKTINSINNQINARFPNNLYEIEYLKIKELICVIVIVQRAISHPVALEGKYYKRCHADNFLMESEELINWKARPSGNTITVSRPALLRELTQILEKQLYKNGCKSHIFYLYVKQITERPDVPYRHYFSYLRVEWKDVDSFSLELAQEFLQSRSYTLNYHNGEAYDDLTVNVAVMEPQEFCEKFDDAFCAANGNVNRRNLMDVEKALKNFFFGLEQRIKEKKNDEGIDVQEGNDDIPF